MCSEPLFICVISVLRCFSDATVAGSPYAVSFSVTMLLQAWVTTISFMSGASIFAVFVGIITTVLIAVDEGSSQFYQKLEVVNQYMAHRKLPLDLRNRIRDAMDYKWRTRRTLDEVIPPPSNKPMRNPCARLSRNVP